MNKTIYSSVEEYIKAFPVPTQMRLNDLKNLICELVPEAKEKISYQMPTFSLNGVFLYFGAYAKHIGFYPGVKTIEYFRAELSDFKTFKGTVQFRLNQLLPIELITRMILFRVYENQ